MNANFPGLLSVVLSAAGFAWVHSTLRRRRMSVRLRIFAVFAVLSVPAALFTLYYLHVLPEYEWLYTLRSWRGSELLGVFLGCAGGALASMLSRMLLIFPLLGSVAFAFAPYVKPMVTPLEDSDLKDRWEGNVCLQSTGSTCGPASVCTVLKHLGAAPSEISAARSAYSTMSGTEAWYLARYVRSQGFVPHFRFRKTFAPSVGLPAVVGVTSGGNGHFIAVLEIIGDQVTVADPMRGEEHLTLSEFEVRYRCTGFHMVISRN
ncbi:MAG: peptidase bacteriocin processing [Verrucomicrobiaceae bacterium]|nr:peptidase bacteriocin processing [Verrucomicrobiaceae bacterium]